MPETYNGWTNWETWCCMTWMGEDGDYWVEDAKNYNQPTGFAESIRETIEASVESYLPNSGFLTDLVYRGLHKVNWLEIAHQLMNKQESDD